VLADRDGSPSAPGGDWPSVSLIVPAWNEAASIRACLASVAKLDYPDWEVVVVAGGTDGTADLARAVVAELPGGRVIDQRPSGKPSAVAAGVRETTGDVIVVLDADSVVAPEWLRSLVQPIDTHIRATTGDFAPRRSTVVSRAEQADRVVVYQSRGHATLQGSGGIAIARDAFELVGGIPSDAVADDWVLDARLAAHGIGRTFAPGAQLVTERPATFTEFWRNELRWRRAHLQSIRMVPEQFLRRPEAAIRELYPYLTAWGLIGLLVTAVASRRRGHLQASRLIRDVAVSATAWSLLRPLAIPIEAAATERNGRILRDAWARPVLWTLSLVAGAVAALIGGRPSLTFKGPRPAAPRVR
jgi:cellulose synthase/poly-beta-1,6-N-acetylglucosamine synthase-like glycosyltransferase